MATSDAVTNSVDSSARRRGRPAGRTLALAAGGITLAGVVATVVAAGTAYADPADLLGGSGGDSSASGGGDDVVNAPGSPHAQDGAPAGVPIADTAHVAVAGAQSMVPQGGGATSSGSSGGGY